MAKSYPGKRQLFGMVVIEAFNANQIGKDENGADYPGMEDVEHVAVEMCFSYFGITIYPFKVDEYGGKYWESIRSNHGALPVDAQLLAMLDRIHKVAEVRKEAYEKLLKS